MHTTINEHFHFWLRSTFNQPPTKGSVHYELLQLAFFNGAWSLLASLLAFVSGEVNDEVVFNSLSRWKDEVRGFMQTELEKGQDDR